MVVFCRASVLMYSCSLVACYHPAAASTFDVSTYYGSRLQSLNLPEQELLSILQLLLPPVTPPLAASCKQHSSRLRALAASAVGAAEEACMAHIRAKGELSPTDAALHVKVAKAAYAAAAVDGLTPQAPPPSHLHCTVLALPGPPLLDRYLVWFEASISEQQSCLQGVQPWSFVQYLSHYHQLPLQGRTASSL